MPSCIDEPAAEHFDDLVDGIGKLKAAILDMDRSLRIALVRAVHIDDACHCAS